MPTDQLNPGEGKSVKTVNEDDIEKILATSEVLKPEFMQKTCLNPYFVSKKKAKEMRKVSTVFPITCQIQMHKVSSGFPITCQIQVYGKLIFITIFLLS